jgi:hypothetical protein
LREGILIVWVTASTWKAQLLSGAKIGSQASWTHPRLMCTWPNSPNRIGQTYAITYSPDHVWYWFPRMRRDEALVFKTYESLADGRAHWTAHTEFHDPTSAPDARPRESIEIRTLAFF